MGTIELAVPKVRPGSYYPSSLQPRRPAEQALRAVVQEAYVHEVSTRKVDAMIKALGLDGLSKSQVSRICQELDTVVEPFRARQLAAEYLYLWVDATYHKVRVDGGVVSQATAVAVGVTDDGERHVLGVDTGASEDGAFWTAFLRSLVRRGAGRAPGGLGYAREAQAGGRHGAEPGNLAEVLHFMRNLLALVPHAAREAVAAVLRTVFAQPDHASAPGAAREGRRRPAGALRAASDIARRRGRGPIGSQALSGRTPAVPSPRPTDAAMLTTSSVELRPACLSASSTRSGRGSLPFFCALRIAAVSECCGLMIVPIFPPLNGECAERFRAFAMKLVCAQRARSANDMSSALEEEISWCPIGEVFFEEYVLAYEACIRVLSDLARLRWRIVEQGYGFALENRKERVRGRPTAEIMASKEMLRRELQPVVDDQKRHPAVLNFIARMEREDRSGRRSVQLLMADGAELAARLAPARELGGEERVEGPGRRHQALSSGSGQECGSDNRASASRDLALFSIQLVDPSSVHAGTAAPVPRARRRASGASRYRYRRAEQLSSRNGREARENTSAGTSRQSSNGSSAPQEGARRRWKRKCNG